MKWKGIYLQHITLFSRSLTPIVPIKPIFKLIFEPSVTAPHQPIAVDPHYDKGAWQQKMIYKHFYKLFWCVRTFTIERLCFFSQDDAIIFTSVSIDVPAKGGIVMWNHRSDPPLHMVGSLWYQRKLSSGACFINRAALTKNVNVKNIFHKKLLLL